MLDLGLYSDSNYILSLFILATERMGQFQWQIDSEIIRLKNLTVTTCWVNVFEHTGV